MTGQPTSGELAAGLRALADFIDAHPELPRPDYLERVNVWWPRTRVAEVIRAGKAARIPVEIENSDVQRNVVLRFGALTARALVDKEQVCERVVVGQEVRLVPDPAFLPPSTPMIEQIVDVTEWRCLPLLAPREPADA